MPFRKSSPPGDTKPPAGVVVNLGDPINRNLLSCYLFNEKGGARVIDVATGLNHGISATALNWSARRKSGSGGSILFALASPQPINCGVNPSVVMTAASKFSFSAWVRSTTSGTNISVCGKYNSTTGTGYFFNCINSASGGNVYMQVQSAASVYIYRIGTKPVSNGAWHHIAGTYSGTSNATTGIRLYVDGVEEVYSDTQTVGGALGSISTTSSFTIAQRGNVGASPLPYDGNIDNLRFYTNRVLTPTDVYRLYSEPFAGLITPRRRIISQTAGIQLDAATNSGYQTAQSTYTWNHTCSGNNRYLVVGISMLSVLGSSVSSITYNGVSMTFLGAKASASGAIRVEQWGLIAPSTGSNVISVALSASLDSIGGAYSFTNVHQTSPTESLNSSSATNVGAADASVNITTVADSDLVINTVASSDASITIGAGHTSRWNVTGALGSGAGADKGIITPAGIAVTSWTDIGALATWSIIGIALRPTTAAVLATGRTPKTYIYIF